MNLQPTFELLNIFAQILFLVFAAYLIVRFFLNRTQTIDFHLSLLVIFLALAVSLTAFVGFIGQLVRANLLLGTVLIFLICVMASINRVMEAKYLWSPYHKEKTEPNIGWVLAIITVTLCSAGLVSALNVPPIAHDVMTYHLFFPARWIQDGSLFYIPSVFGDLAPTYSPSNGELVYTFLSVPFGRDTLARAGQFPFLLLAMLSIYLLARELGASPKGATIPLALAALSPLVFRQGFSAEVDLVMGASFVASLYYLSCYQKQATVSTALLFGLCLGLFLGSKYVSVTFSPLLTIPFLYFTIRQMGKNPVAPLFHLGLVAVAAMLTGGFWYLRNWIITGNPLFPLDLSPLFSGVYGRAAMMASPFHIPTINYVFPVWIYAYGPIMMPVALFSMTAGLIWIFRRKVNGLSVYIYLLPLLIALLHFAVVPYNSQYRFLIPAVLLSYLPLAILDDNPKWRWPVRGFFGLMLAINIVGIGRSFNIASIPISGLGLVPHAYLIHFILLLALSGLVFFLIRKLKFTSPVALAGSFFICFATAFFLMPFLFSGQTRQVVAVRSNPSSEYPIAAWSYVNQLPEASVVAYSGNNVPYYLLGSRWQNKVVYVNVCGPDNYLLHDYFKQCHTLSKCPLPSSSDKPGFLWRLAERGVWLKNLRNTGAEYLFVTPMNAMEANYIPHDKKGYPVERTWADELGDIFTQQGNFGGARLYKIDRINLFDRILGANSG